MSSFRPTNYSTCSVCGHDIAPEEDRARNAPSRDSDDKETQYCATCAKKTRQEGWGQMGVSFFEGLCLLAH